MARLLVTVAHPDDETFGTGSVIASAAAAGAEVTVCCATRGEAGERHGVASDADLAAIREAELRAAANVLGAHRVVVLGYGDSDMEGTAAPGTLAAAPLHEVAARIAELIAEVRPDVVVTLDPTGGDGHRDHIAIGEATVEACRSFPDVRLYAWTVPRSVLTRWFAELAEVRPDAGQLGTDAASQEQPGRPDTDITTILDVRSVRDLRGRAMAAHASQVAPFEGMSADLREDFLATDHLVRLQPPWTGGETERDLGL